MSKNQFSTMEERTAAVLGKLDAIGRDLRDSVDAGDAMPLPESTAQPDTPPAQSTEEIIQSLALLPPVEYDQKREDAAKILGIRTSTLDASVKGVRATTASDGDTPFENVEPWHESVGLACILNEITESIQRHIICCKHTAHAAALWIVMTYFVDHFDITAIAIITAPEMRCGKSDFKRLIAKMVLRPLEADGMSAAVLFRGFDLWGPTLVIDEYDTFVKDDEDLRGVINSGHQRGGCVWRCVGDDHTPKRFNVFGPKVLAGIGRLAPTVMDRGIILQLRRKLPTETIVRQRDVPKVFFRNIQSKLARIAIDYANSVSAARPTLPGKLGDRAQDNWEPLFQIAQVAGDGWLKRAHDASLKLSGQDEDVKTIGVELLSDIQEAFAIKNVDRLSSAELIKMLCDDDEKRWATHNKGFPIKPAQVAKKLREYGIHSNTIRVYGNTAKGYMLKQFDDSFERYIFTDPAKDGLSVTPSQTNEHAGLGVTAMLRVTDAEVTRNTKVTRKPNAGAGCDVVTDITEKTPILGGAEASRPNASHLRI